MTGQGSDSTVVVELTPPGRAAVAVVLVAGDRSLDALRQSFLPNTAWPVEGPATGRLSVGRWGSDEGEELVVCRKAEREFEVHCHGGAAAVQKIVGTLTTLGCRKVSWQTWLTEGNTRRTHLGAAITRAAEVSLASAATARTASILLDQSQGALSAAIRKAIAAIEAVDWARAAATIEGVLAHRDVGMHLTSPWRIVISGAPNVGKSSLINALSGYRRAIVSPTAGTTRDVVTASSAIDGWPVVFADTAGLRETQDEIESAGVALARAVRASADLILEVTDATDSPTALQNDVNVGPHGLAIWPKIIAVRNKCDLLVGPQESQVKCNDAGKPSEPLFVSALTGAGIGELIVAIGRALAPQPPLAGDAVAFTSHQFASLDVAYEAVQGRHYRVALETLSAMLAFDDYPSQSR